MVPNSLGPGELLLHYGTDEQKKHYLPRLAKGLEIPVLRAHQSASGLGRGVDSRLRHRRAGASTRAQRVLGLRLTWDKRYITLGPVATLLGLAFRAYDPDHLLGDEEDLGITCALIPTTHPGVHIGRRHMPLNAVFQNGPNWGKRRVHPDGLGHRRAADARASGWRMLMECLAAGRGISLPSSNTGDGQARGARDRRLCARAHAVQDADRHASKASRSRSRAWAATST